ncbi:hypothetical protein LR48_Vigan11g127000 [Vigna angularis]|uniref:Uncharacterized protein n=1 Tax=Phaseolus angularis TaxID=3914 RepID=A0A0L9VT24_PHAAN|nr:hypothetical protein LR48_Vigan11g127000 [Vigna angularis]
MAVILFVLPHSSCSKNFFIPFVCSCNASLLPQAMLATPPPTPRINISGTSISFLKRSPNPSLKNPHLIILTLTHHRRHSPNPNPSHRPNLRTQTHNSHRPSRTCTRPHLNASSHSTAQASSLCLHRIRPTSLTRITNRPPPLLTTYFTPTFYSNPSLKRHGSDDRGLADLDRLGDKRRSQGQHRTKEDNCSGDDMNSGGRILLATERMTIAVGDHRCRRGEVRLGSGKMQRKWDAFVA